MSQQLNKQLLEITMQKKNKNNAVGSENKKQEKEVLVMEENIMQNLPHMYHAYVALRERIFALTPNVPMPRDFAKWEREHRSIDKDIDSLNERFTLLIKDISEYHLEEEINITLEALGYAIEELRYIYLSKLQETEDYVKTPECLFNYMSRALNLAQN